MQFNSFRTFPVEEKIRNLQRQLVIRYIESKRIGSKHNNVVAISISLTSGNHQKQGTDRLIALATAFKIPKRADRNYVMQLPQSQWIDEPKNVWSFNKTIQSWCWSHSYSFFFFPVFLFIQWFFCAVQKIEIYFLLWHCHRIIYEFIAMQRLLLLVVVVVVCCCIVKWGKSHLKQCAQWLYECFWMFKLAVTLNPVLISCFKLYFNQVQLIFVDSGKSCSAQLKVKKTKIGDNDVLLFRCECILCSKEKEKNEYIFSIFFGGPI